MNLLKKHAVLFICSFKGLCVIVHKIPNMKFSFPAFLVWLWTCTIFVDAYWSTSDTIETKEYLLSTDFSTWKEKYFAAKLWKLLDSVQDFPICKCPSDDTFRNTQELFYFELLKIECCEKVSVNNNAHVWIDGLKVLTNK